MCLNRPQKGNPRCTLIVAPVSVMAAWFQHLKHYTKPGLFKTLIVEDSNYERTFKKIKNNKVDVVIISYAKLASIAKKYEPFFDALFHRVILDEAHIVRNRKSKVFQAV